MKPGRALELLVATLEKVVPTSSIRTIHSPFKLRDRITGRLREHDVVIEYTELNRTILVAIECRDQSRKVTCHQVEAFSRKCADTGVHQAVIVSSSGFAGTAKLKAAHSNIECLVLDEVREFDWCGMTHMPYFEAIILSVTINPQEDRNEGIKAVLGPDLREIPKKRLDAMFSASIDRSLQLTEGDYCSEVTSLAGHFIQFDPSGDIVPVKGASMRWKVVKRHAPVRKFTYHAEGKGGDTAMEAVVARIDKGDFEGDVVFAQQEGSRMTVSFLPNARSKS